MAPVTAVGSQLCRKYFMKKLAFLRSWMLSWSAEARSLNNIFIATFRGVHRTCFLILQRQWVSTSKLRPLPVPMRSAGEESYDTRRSMATTCVFSESRPLMMSGAEGHIAGQRVVDRKKKTFRSRIRQTFASCQSFPTIP